MVHRGTNGNVIPASLIFTHNVTDNRKKFEHQLSYFNKKFIDSLKIYKTASRKFLILIIELLGNFARVEGPLSHVVAGKFLLVFVMDYVFKFEGLKYLATSPSEG